MHHGGEVEVHEQTVSDDKRLIGHGGGHADAAGLPEQCDQEISERAHEGGCFRQCCKRKQSAACNFLRIFQQKIRDKKQTDASDIHVTAARKFDDRQGMPCI